MRTAIRRPAGLRLWAVRIRDASGAADGPDWLLYTNVPVFTEEHARGIVASYEARWRAEEFHRTWKQGHCNVEDAQLHSERAVIVWATILSAVATRIERLKYLSRKTPDAPANVELSEQEIEALKLEQTRRWTKKKRLPDVPSIGIATGWVAQLGGWHTRCAQRTARLRHSRQRPRTTRLSRRGNRARTSGDTPARPDMSPILRPLADERTILSYANS